MQKDRAQKLWREFSPPDAQRPMDEEKRRFDALKTYFTAGMDSGRFDEAIKRALCSRWNEAACSRN